MQRGPRTEAEADRGRRRGSRAQRSTHETRDSATLRPVQRTLAPGAARPEQSPPPPARRRRFPSRSTWGRARCRASRTAAEDNAIRRALAAAPSTSAHPRSAARGPAVRVRRYAALRSIASCASTIARSAKSRLRSPDSGSASTGQPSARASSARAGAASARLLGPQTSTPRAVDSRCCAISSTSALPSMLSPWR